MDLGLDEAQQMLKNSARVFLEAECPDTYVREMEQDERGYTPELWQKMAEQGWLGLIVPEKYGGVGLTFLDLALLLEEMGKAMLPGPFFSTVVMAGMTILDAGSEEQKQELLPRIAEGQLILTLALTEPSARWDAVGVETIAKTQGTTTLSAAPSYSSQTPTSPTTSSSRPGPARAKKTYRSSWCPGTPTVSRIPR